MPNLNNSTTFRFSYTSFLSLSFFFSYKVQPGQPYYMPHMHQQNMPQYQMRGNFPHHTPYMQQGYNSGPRGPGAHGMMEEEGGYPRNGGGRGRGRGGRSGRNRRGGGRGDNRRYSNSGYVNNSIHPNNGQDTAESNGDAAEN